MMTMQRYQLTLTGQTPLLMHQDNIPWSERVKAWIKDPANKKNSVKGDDRSPAWTWLGYSYHDKNTMVIDSDNLMAMFRDAGQKCPTGKGNESLKLATQTGIKLTQIAWPLTNAAGQAYGWPKIAALRDEEDFEVHEQTAVQNGFELFVKRAKIGSSKNVRVRPRFDDWKTSGIIEVSDSRLKLSVLQTIMDVAGSLVGLCDWRPGSGSASGRYGMFTATVEKI